MLLFVFFPKQNLRQILGCKEPIWEVKPGSRKEGVRRVRLGKAHKMCIAR